MTWTQDRVDMLEKLWTEGLSASACARRINYSTESDFSRNAIIGKVSRLGLQSRKTTLRRSSRESRAIARKAMAKATKSNPHSPRFGQINPNAKQRFEPAPTPLEDTPQGPVVSLADIGPSQCRYPYGDPKRAGFGFCGCESVPGLSYCERHVSICFRPTERPKKRGAVRETGVMDRADIAMESA